MCTENLDLLCAIVYTRDLAVEPFPTDSSGVSGLTMKLEIEPEEKPYLILTHEQADQLVTEALDTDLNEPEPLVRMLLILFDHAEEPRLADAIYLLMKVAYNGSIVHSTHLHEYLDGIRQGRNPLEEARPRGFGEAESEG